MLTGPKAAKILERILKDPNSFMENGELEEADWLPMNPGLLTSLGRDVRFALAIANLKVALATQRKALGSN